MRLRSPRLTLGAAAFMLLAGARAQVGAGNMIFDAIRSGQNARLLPTALQQNPLQPKGFPNPDAKFPVQEGALPAAPNPNGQFEIIKATTPYLHDENVRIEDGAEFRYRGYHIFADRVEGSRITHIFSLSGNVQVIGEDAVVRGDRIVVDLDRETYHSYVAESQVSPRYLGGAFRDKAYVKGRESFGSRRETRTFGAEFTTCNLERPHYEITGEDTVVRPGIRAIFRKASIVLFGRTVLRLPFLSIPLDERTYENLPVVGQSPDEGYYIKTHYGIPLKGQSELRTRLDYMSKLGVGYGADYRYVASRLAGYLRFYAVSGDSNTLNVSNQHQQRLSFGTLTINTDLQRSNYLTAPESTILQNRVSLAIPQRTGNTLLGFNRTSNETAGYKTNNQTVTLSDQRNFGHDTRTTLDVSWLTSGQTSGSTSNSREQLDVRFRATEDMTRAQATLEYQRTIPIGDTGNYFSGADRTPVITLQSDARRLFGDQAARDFPFRTELSIGEFQMAQTGDHVSRGNFDFNFQKSDIGSGRFRMTYNGEFRQSFYSDDTAQYVLNGGTTFSYALGRDTSANLRYNYLHPFGYTPLSIDSTGRTDLASLDVSYRPIRSLITGIQTGYDFEQLDRQETPWQQVGIRTEFTPRKWFLFRTLSTYDTFQEEWSSVRLDFGYQPGATLVTLGARYDGIRKVWSNANLFINDLKIGRTKLSAIFAYNGYTKQFDSKQYTAIYDLHCAEAILTIIENNTGFRAGREVQFFIRLKAFPFDSIFGVGQRGQPIGTGTGRDF